MCSFQGSSFHVSSDHVIFILSLFLPYSYFLASFGPPSLASCHCLSLLFLLSSVNHLNYANPYSPSVPFFCSSFACLVPIFLSFFSSCPFPLVLFTCVVPLFFVLFSFFLPVHPYLLNRANLPFLCLSQFL